MRVLVVGGGGREHTLVWKLAQSPSVSGLICAPGNAGIAQQAELAPVGAEDLPALLDLARRRRVDLAVIGPEAPLVAGVADLLQAEGIKVYGPGGAAARLEGSKVFAKQLMSKYDIPTAPFEVFDGAEEARRHLRRQGAPIVVKADGLCAGKGALVCRTLQEALRAVERLMVEREFGVAGETVVIEECLSGQEASLKAFCDGVTLLPMVPSQDHKPIFDHDQGPNTGGMGCYTPVPAVTGEILEFAVERVLRRTLEAMAEEGLSYRGTLYAGLILTPNGPQVLEFNARFGDPETQVVLPRLDGDLLEVLQAAAEGRLAEIEPRWTDQAAVCVVMASGGYPGPYEKGKVISGLDQAGALPDVVVFHAGTARRDGEWITNGGRVLGVTALGDDLRRARDRAYQAVDRIEFEDAHCRRDIAAKALGDEV